MFLGAGGILGSVSAMSGSRRLGRSAVTWGLAHCRTRSRGVLRRLGNDV